MLRRRRSQKISRTNPSTEIERWTRGTRHGSQERSHQQRSSMNERYTSMNKLTEDRLGMKSCHALVVPIRRGVRQERPLGEKRCQANSAYTRGVKALKEMGNTPARSTYCSAPTDNTLSRRRECRLVAGLAGAFTHTLRTLKKVSLISFGSRALLLKEAGTRPI